MALVQQIQLQQGEPGARGRARRVAGSPALRMVGRRILAAIPVIIGVSFLTFAIMSTLPNNTAQTILGLNASQAAVAQLAVHRLSREFGEILGRRLREICPDPSEFQAELAEFMDLLKA